MPILARDLSGGVIASGAHTLTGAENDYDPLLDLIGGARFVLLGEASHGTHEFYRERATITQRLIKEKNFSAVAVEADWPDAYRVNRYVRGMGADSNAPDALSGFKRFPTWMWRNTDVVNFVDWLRLYNDGLNSFSNNVGFYGLDLYSLFTSIDEVLRFLEQTDAGAAKLARARYACFDHFNQDSQLYGQSINWGLSDSCEQAVIAQLQDICASATGERARDGSYASDGLFYARQNAKLVVNAEKYYRTMFRGRISSWNLRDQHMAETLDDLAQHLSAVNGVPAKIVIWAHNSHIGDARATEVGQQGEWTLGQLAREKYGTDAFLVGFSTFHGTVTAASDWDAPAERKRVRPAIAGSYEALLHDAGIANFMLLFREKNALTQMLSAHLLERAIGVIYRPQTERQSHYFFACLPKQYDAVLHFDKTRAVEPLEPLSCWKTGEAPETYPVGV
jgi:erythromycin esterase-like protein